jgi:hypothetical protein
VDYQALSGTVTIPAGKASVTFPVGVRNTSIRTALTFQIVASRTNALGFTNTGLGVATALQDKSNKEVVLLSDGEPNFMDCACNYVGSYDEGPRPRINGGSSQLITGAIYFPNQSVCFTGNSSVAGAGSGISPCCEFVQCRTLIANHLYGADLFGPRLTWKPTRWLTETAVNQWEPDSKCSRFAVACKNVEGYAAPIRVHDVP